MNPKLTQKEYLHVYRNQDDESLLFLRCIRGSPQTHDNISIWSSREQSVRTVANAALTKVQGSALRQVDFPNADEAIASRHHDRLRLRFTQNRYGSAHVYRGSPKEIDIFLEYAQTVRIPIDNDLEGLDYL